MKRLILATAMLALAACTPAPTPSTHATNVTDVPDRECPRADGQPCR